MLCQVEGFTDLERRFGVWRATKCAFMKYGVRVLGLGPITQVLLVASRVE